MFRCQSPNILDKIRLRIESQKVAHMYVLNLRGSRKDLAMTMVEHCSIALFREIILGSKKGITKGIVTKVVLLLVETNSKAKYDAYWLPRFQQ